jgi:hypothetical protein
MRRGWEDTHNEVGVESLLRSGLFCNRANQLALDEKVVCLINSDDALFGIGYLH